MSAILWRDLLYTTNPVLSFAFVVFFPIKQGLPFIFMYLALFLVERKYIIFPMERML